MYEKVKKKSYVRLVTSLGDLNVELHTDMVPKTCHNFILLCKRGYYNNTIFHRSIRNFMVQGGDPTGKRIPGVCAYFNETKIQCSSPLLFDTFIFHVSSRHIKLHFATDLSLIISQ